ncbi:MAG: FliG C-terminal domain-containing protein [Bryobacteraceae bacterium]
MAQVLNHLDSGASTEVLEQIAAEDPGRAQNIRQLMFLFADLVNVSAESLKTLLARADRKMFTLALKGAEPKRKKTRHEPYVEPVRRNAGGRPDGLGAGPRTRRPGKRSNR